MEFLPYIIFYGCYIVGAFGYLFFLVRRLGAAK